MNKYDILSAAEAQGYSVAALSGAQIGVFVGCVLLKIIVMPLPQAIAECWPS